MYGVVAQQNYRKGERPPRLQHQPQGNSVTQVETPPPKTTQLSFSKRLINYVRQQFNNEQGNVGMKTCLINIIIICVIDTFLVKIYYLPKKSIKS